MNKGNGIHYVKMRNCESSKIVVQERLFYDTPNGDVEILLDKDSNDKVVGIEIIDFIDD